MKYSINLFPTKESQLPKQIFEFIAYYLRYALVITLFIVIVIFFLRMQLDRAIVEEKEKLSLKKSIVLATKDLREELERTQDRMTLIKGILGKQDIFKERLNYFLSTIPRNASIETVVFGEKETRVEGVTADYRIVQLYINKLKKDNKYESVQVDKITRDKDKKYYFSLTLNYRTQTKVVGQNSKKGS